MQFFLKALKDSRNVALRVFGIEVSEEEDEDEEEEEEEVVLVVVVVVEAVVVEVIPVRGVVASGREGGCGICCLVTAVDTFINVVDTKGDTTSFVC